MIPPLPAMITICQTLEAGLDGRRHQSVACLILAESEASYLVAPIYSLRDRPADSLVGRLKEMTEALSRNCTGPMGDFFASSLPPNTREAFAGLAVVYFDDAGIRTAMVHDCAGRMLITRRAPGGSPDTRQVQSTEHLHRDLHGADEAIARAMVAIVCGICTTILPAGSYDLAGERT